MNDYRYTENDLNVNLNELIHEILREMFLAAKKVSIYSSGHPLSQKAIGRTLFQMEKLFKFKRYINLIISSGQLYAINISTRQSVFTDQIMNYMRMLDVNNILFDSDMTAQHLSSFLERFVKMLPATDFKNLLANHLKDNNVNTIHINTELCNNLFKNGHRFQGDIADDFSVRNIVGQVIGDDFDSMAKLTEIDELGLDEFIKKYNHDYYPELITFLIPEKIASIDSDDIVNQLNNQIYDIVGEKEHEDNIDEVKAGEIKKFISALNYHPQREEIIERIGSLMVMRGVKREIYKSILPQVSAMKVESSEKIDEFLYATFNKELPGYGLDDFKDLFSRLLRTAQQGKARSVVNILINHLAGNDLDIRKTALILFRKVLSSYISVSSDFLISHMISKIDEYLSNGTETFEFSDLIWELAQITLAEKKYKHLSDICDLLLKRREQIDGIWNYESVAIKKSVEELNRQEVIKQLVNDLAYGHQSDIQGIKKALVTIGSEETAQALSHIISHESRQVRQNVLKILAEMGKSSLHVFMEAMNDDTLFKREENRRELPDAKWYVVRNSIFVLGSLKDPEACKALRIRMSDSDTRVRRAIIQSLERIGGDLAADLLLLAADDTDNEIREAAIIALGFVGNEDICPELINLAGCHSSDVIYIITTLGKLGGQVARDFLLELLSDREKQSEITSGRSSRDDLKLAIIKALGRIGDKESLNKIREFTDSLSASSKIFLGGSKLSKTADEILKRKK